MGFLDTLRRVLGGESTGVLESRDTEALDRNPQAGEPADEPHGAYDRAKWHKKLKRILDELPDSRPEWDGLIQEARALEFDPEWVTRCQIDEFLLMIRRAVADRLFTEAEHRKLDLARELIGITEREAESALHSVVAEAEQFFGKPVEEE